MGIITTFLTATFVGVILTLIFEFVLKTNKKLRDRYYKRHEILFGYHVHHSTIGLLLIILGVLLFLLNQTAVALNSTGIGLGIIIMHTISSNRFVFIEKESFSKSQKSPK